MEDMRPQGEPMPDDAARAGARGSATCGSRGSSSFALALIALGVVIHVGPRRSSCKVFSGRESRARTLRPPFFAVDVVPPAPRLQGNPGVDLIRFKDEETRSVESLRLDRRRTRGSPASRSIGPWTSSPGRACRSPSELRNEPRAGSPRRNRRRPPGRTTSHEPRRNPGHENHDQAVIRDRDGRARRAGSAPREGSSAQSTIGDMASDVRFDQKLGARLPLGPPLPRRVRPGGPPGRLSRPTSGDPGPGLLRLPAALQPGPQRPDPDLEAALARRRHGLRRGGRQHQPRRDARAGAAEEGGVPGALRPARRRGAGLALPDRATRERSTTSAGPIGFRYRLQPPDRSSMPTPPASW